MSINHFSPDLQQTLWWSNQQQQKPSNTATTPWDYPQQQHNSWNKSIPYEHRPLGLNLNDCGGAHHEEEEEDKGGEEQQGTNTTRMEDREMQQIDKQHLFEKPLTPSDVGKLNRLVIPKQHAEKYFPLGADAGLLLSFEDEGGKCWRFRYSYWSSSQSYVLTKGWSRYVKDKQLDAGDVILFDRHRINSDRLFIGWRRRGASVEETANKEGGGGSARVQLQVGGGGVGEAGGGSANWTQGFYSAQYSYPTHHVPSVPDQRIRPSEPESLNLPTGNSRRLRLFGVNLECQMDDSEPSTPEDSSASSQGLPLFSPSPYPSNFQEQYHQQTDMSLYQDVNHYLHRNIRDGRG